MRELEVAVKSFESKRKRFLGVAEETGPVRPGPIELAFVIPMLMILALGVSR